MSDEKYQQAGPKVQPGAKEEMVYTWPYLVSIEAIMAVAMILALTIMSTFVNAPLLDLANADCTPNPAKAPWYFLGLQELLLHMNPALAGVIVPTAVLVLLGMIPYIDQDRRGTGIWFSTKKGVPIAIFSSIYTAVIEIGLVIFDQFLILPGMAEGSKGLAKSITHLLSTGPIQKGLTWLVDLVQLDVLIKTWDPKYTEITDAKIAWIGEIFVPMVIMIAIPWILVLIVRKRFNANTREIMIALYSFFLTSFVVLSIIGTAFRGEGMNLMWPWELKQPKC
jgi:menaquinol-cytochrome c reductase cytochrome b/c subunit